ncbi:MAG: hypothetical protein O7E52_22435 [Candidatus Poribacteria bacterium]|nr:hypothetical protein [Candidatus Poribacteria bacterium]
MPNAIQDQPQRVIQNRLSAIQRRMQINCFFQNLARYSFWGLCIGAIVLIANRFFPFPMPIGFAFSLPLVIAIAIAASLSLFRKTDLLAIARLVDQRLHLKERLSTALEAIYRELSSDFAILQIRDAAKVAEKITPSTAISYTRPSMLKWLPIPVLLVGLSFFAPRMYEVPPPPTAAERAAINDAAARLEGDLRNIDDAKLTEQIQDTVKALRDKRIDVQAAQSRLRDLRDEIRAKESQIAGDDVDRAVEAISKMGETSKFLIGTDAGEIASELEKIADQMDGLTAAQQAELDALLRKLAEQLAGNPAAKSLTNQLKGIETQALSPEMLKKIVDSLRTVNQQKKEIAQLEQILEEIQASRKNIGLAGLEMPRKTGGVASRDGGPGEESETGEAQGTQVGDETSENFDTQTEDLRLTGVASDSSEFSSVATQDNPSGENEPTYLQYREVYLSAKQAYTEAIERDQIPVRYQQQVKAYLEAIANPTP